ncbi:MAG: tetratricopeptide repeat protein [Hyphomicrobiaceae bacterium]
MDEKTVRKLQMIALASGVAVLLALVWDQVRQRPPGDAAYQAATHAFRDRDYERAAVLFAQAMKENPANPGAKRGRANSLVQLARLDEAYAAITSVIASEPGNACNYATRGIVEDHRGNYKAAMTDYARAVAGCPAASKGMSWFQRVLTNTHERPPTVAERLAYLRAQMALPEDQRVLRLPEIDRAQKPYEE